MSKLEEDTRVSGSDGSFRGSLHPDWQIWFPNGGYMATMALRAVGATSAFAQPLSMACHFVSVAKLEDVDVLVQTRRKTRNAESLSFSIEQAGKTIIHGVTWMGQPVDGYEHDQATMPDVPHWKTLRSTREFAKGEAPHPFWKNLEQRPVTGDFYWQQAESGEAVQLDWLRFASEDIDEDPCANAGRALVLIDSFGWPAAARAHVDDPRFIAPSLSLSVDFHRFNQSQWMLSEARAPVARDGFIRTQNHLWNDGGELVATGSATLMCRPRPGVT